MDHVLLENHAWIVCGDCCLGWVVGMVGGMAGYEHGHQWRLMEMGGDGIPQPLQ